MYKNKDLLAISSFKKPLIYQIYKILSRNLVNAVTNNVSAGFALPLQFYRVPPLKQADFLKRPLKRGENTRNNLVTKVSLPTFVRYQITTVLNLILWDSSNFHPLHWRGGGGGVKNKKKRAKFRLLYRNIKIKWLEVKHLFLHFSILNYVFSLN